MAKFYKQQVQDLLQSAPKRTMSEKSEASEVYR